MSDKMESKEEPCLNQNKSYPCLQPAQEVLKLVSKKWAIQLIYLLGKERRMRFNQLKTALHKGWAKDRISDATLSARLSELTKKGLVVRKVISDSPPKVDYFLSAEGEELAEALEPLVDWTISFCHKKHL